MRTDVEAFISQESNDISEHLLGLYDLILKRKPQVIVECGIRTGNSTYAIRRAARMVNARYVGIDTNPSCKEVFEKDPIDGLNEKFINMSDVDWVHTLPDEEAIVDMVFIDTCHEYNHTKKELQAFYEILACNGIIVLHDTNDEKYPDVAKALSEFLHIPIDWSKPFQGFVDKWRVTHFTNCHGLTVLEDVS